MVGTPAVVQKTIDQLQFQVRKLSDYLQRDNWFRRRLLTGISVSTSAVTVSHRLGYVPEGYLVVRSSAGVTVYDTALTSESLTLVASGTATISLIVW
jgi:hypothetical protein